MSHDHSREKGRFCGVGIANSIVGLPAIYAAKWFLFLGDVATNSFGYSVGLLLSFALTIRWTFPYPGPYLPALAKFVFVTLATVLGTNIYFGMDSQVAQAEGVVRFTLTS